MPYLIKKQLQCLGALKSLIGRFGVPVTIISDKGREFCNELNDRFCSKSRHICAAYHRQSNSFTERSNQTICACLCKFSDGRKLNWEGDLDLILLGYRLSMQSSSLYSPFELVYGVKARLPIELDLPTHTFQQDEDGSHMDMLMENLKILAWRNEVMLIRIFSKPRPPRKGSMIENT